MEQNKAHVAATVPSRLRLWVTEMGVYPAGPLCWTWLEALFYAMLDLLLPEIEQLDILTPYCLVCGDPTAPSFVTSAKVRKTPSWPRSWANFSLLQLYSHRNTRANWHLLGQPKTFLAWGHNPCRPLRLTGREARVATPHPGANRRLHGAPAKAQQTAPRRAGRPR